MKLLDTSVAVDHLRGLRAATAVIEDSLEHDILTSSELVRFELLAGVRPRDLTALEQFFSAIAWVAVTEDVARTAGNLARTYRPSHSGAGHVDYLLAATAVVLDAELITTNVRHFPMFRSLRAPY